MTFGTTSSNISFVITPGLKITGISLVTSKTVDSMPTFDLPPSIMMSTLSLKSSNTCSKSVEDGFPLILALGAQIGTPAISMTLNAMS